MRTYKTIITGILITILAAAYVHQRVEIVKAGYDVQESRKYLSHLVDQNSALMYNLSKLESPRNLLASLDAEEIEFAKNGKRKGPTYRIARADVEKPGQNDGVIGRFLDLFTPNAEARPRE